MKTLVNKIHQDGNGQNKFIFKIFTRLPYIVDNNTRDQVIIYYDAFKLRS